MLHLLNHRLDTIDGEYVVLGERAARAPRPPRPQPGLLERLRSQRRVMRALIIRETRTRFADTRLGYGWALIEPMLHIALLSATFAVLMHGRPPIGADFFMFYYTGLIPYHVFVHTSTGMSHALINNAPLLQLPPVSSFDVIAARGLLEVMTDVVVAVVLLAGFLAIGLRAMPDDLWEPSIAVLAIAAFGCGIGFVNAVVTVFWRSWEKTYAQLTRLLYFVSGIFYVPGMMPDWVRDILVWNPLLHAIDWFRAGFFRGVPAALAGPVVCRRRRDRVAARRPGAAPPAAPQAERAAVIALDARRQILSQRRRPQDPARQVSAEFRGGPQFRDSRRQRRREIDADPPAGRFRDARSRHDPPPRPRVVSARVRRHVSRRAVGPRECRVHRPRLWRRRAADDCALSRNSPSSANISRCRSTPIRPGCGRGSPSAPAWRSISTST